MKRPSRTKAEAAIHQFIDETVGDGVPVTIAEDGDVCWSFWIRHEDTTSYLHPDMTIEWYGTGYAGEDIEGDDIEGYGPGPEPSSAPASAC